MPHELVFYDGQCGLCHRSVLFLLARDRDGSLFRYAPLEGATFRERVDAATRERLPDSIVVLRPDGALLQRAPGVFHLLRRLGGFWGLVGTVGGWVPTVLANWGYDRVAAVRKRLFAQPEEACPVIPGPLRERFLP